MGMIDLTSGSTYNFIITSLVLLVAIFVRYIVLAGLFYYFIFKNKSHRLVQKRLTDKLISRSQIKREIYYSFVTSFVFAIAGTAVLYYWQMGRTKIYFDWNKYPLYWIPISIGLILFIHETYYYWLHRWMHRPSVYKWVHKTHHESLITSAWTSFSFHPMESLLQSLPLFVIVFVIPAHWFAWVVLLVTMTLTSIINHLNSEIYPAKMIHHWLGKWLIGATHHHLHHTQFHFNYGLYFTFWDHFMNTESKEYKKLFAEKTTVE